MKFPNLLAVLALAALAAFWSAPARAHDDDGGDKSEQSGPSRGPKDLGPCKEDAAKACPGLKPGDGKFGACMKEHKDELSDGCREMLAKIKGKMKNRMKDKMKDKLADKVSEACGEDAEKFCSGMKPGDGKFGPCLKEHKDELSDSCKGFMKGMKQRIDKRRGEKGDDKEGGKPEKNAKDDDGDK